MKDVHKDPFRYVTVLSYHLINHYILQQVEEISLGQTRQYLDQKHKVLEQTKENFSFYIYYKWTIKPSELTIN